MLLALSMGMKRDAKGLNSAKFLAVLGALFFSTIAFAEQEDPANVPVVAPSRAQYGSDADLGVGFRHQTKSPDALSFNGQARIATYQAIDPDTQQLRTEGIGAHVTFTALSPTADSKGTSLASPHSQDSNPYFRAGVEYYMGAVIPSYGKSGGVSGQTTSFRLNLVKDSGLGIKSQYLAGFGITISGGSRSTTIGTVFPDPIQAGKSWSLIALAEVGGQRLTPLDAENDKLTVDGRLLGSYRYCKGFGENSDETLLCLSIKGVASIGNVVNELGADAVAEFAKKINDDTERRRYFFVSADAGATALGKNLIPADDPLVSGTRAIVNIGVKAW